MTINIHRIDPNNLGDQVCSPVRYFDEISGIPSVDIDSEWPEVDRIIIGGGGLLHSSWPEKMIYALDNGVKMAAWGIGLNNHDSKQFAWPEKMLSRFSFVGLRDFGNPWHYVPCPSCMSSAFDHVEAPTRRCVIYEHHENPIKVGSGIPRMQNRQPGAFFPSVVQFLGSAEVVLTNTFHGAYWAMLLGRRVVIHNPFSTRHHCFEENPVYSDEGNWSDMIDEAHKPPDGYLNRCRKLNVDFFKNSIIPFVDSPPKAGVLTGSK